MTVGFDFGTTNSLVSVVVGNRAVDVMDSEGRPHPSVVRYEGEEVVVGRDARNALEDVGPGVHGNIVRSPKVLLGSEVEVVGGVERNPIDIVADVIRHVKTESLRSPQGERLDGLRSAVVTIPVTMNGPRRAALREAYRLANIDVVQFVHEPLAAIYGYIRGAADPDDTLRRLSRRNVLVIDWGGGTLDLTLCRVEPTRILQLRNGGTDQVGGDQFDDVIYKEVVSRFARDNGIKTGDSGLPEARLKLRQQAEDNKIALSERESVTFYVPEYFQSSGTTLEYKLGRPEMEEITRPLVDAGAAEIESLLDSVGFAAAQVSQVIVVGGMAAMPAIRSRLHEMFGPERVVVPTNSATLVSQGAAWIAHDAQRLVLAKPIELELARSNYLPLVSAGEMMPTAGGELRRLAHLFCADPTDGRAKFPFVSPTELLQHPQASSRRTTLGVVSIKVDRKAPPMSERLELRIAIDDDLILKVEARSAQANGYGLAEYYHLEFGLGLGSGGGAEAPPENEPESRSNDREAGSIPIAKGIAMRANLADDDRSQYAIPGDVLYLHNRNAFSPPPMPGPRATEEQRREHLYYQPCAVCKRAWGHPDCLCGPVISPLGKR
jgi:molecular chaperone DnaK